MARALVCVVKGERESIDPARLTCHDQSHDHITQSEAHFQVEQGVSEWIKQPTSRRDKGVVRKLRENGAARGLSCKFGAYLSMRLKEKKPWATIMLSDMRRKGALPEDNAMSALRKAAGA